MEEVVRPYCTEEICRQWQVTNEEYEELEKEFGLLCYDQGHDLQRKNYRNNYTDDLDDIVQFLRMAMLRAAAYTKRQAYIESCLTAVKKYATDQFVLGVLFELETLWENKTKHGANRQRFGPHQERLLERLVVMTVPSRKRPNRNAKLKINMRFRRYCKSVTWNCQKNLGKKITRERAIRAGQVSLSDHDYLSVAM